MRVGPPSHELTTTKRGNWRHQGCDTPATRRQPAPNAAKPPPSPIRSVLEVPQGLAVGPAGSGGPGLVAVAGWGWWQWRAGRREKVRPAHPLQHPTREKVRPASVKRPILGCFERAGRTFSRTGHSHVATMQPMTPLQPLMQASVKPPSPMLAPEQQALKPATPLQPKNALKTPISHPQRRWRFQLRLGPREQRRHRFQSAASKPKQRCHRFQTTAHLAYARRLRRKQASMHPLPRKLACNSSE